MCISWSVFVPLVACFGLTSGQLNFLLCVFVRDETIKINKNNLIVCL